MTSAAFLSFSKLHIVIIHGKQNEDIHCMVLEHYLLAIIGIHIQNNHGVQFQQNNASTQTARLVKEWFRFNFVCL